VLEKLRHTTLHAQYEIYNNNFYDLKYTVIPSHQGDTDTHNPALHVYELI